MTKNDIIRLARESNLSRLIGPESTILPEEWEYLARFAQLVAEQEREECAKVSVYLGSTRIAAGIRARGTE